MKSLVFALLILFIYSASMAQGTSYSQNKYADNPPDQAEAKKEQRFSKGELKGPRAKNYPTHRLVASPVVATLPQKKLSERRMGPAAKNYKPWQDDTRTPRTLVTKKQRKYLKGPWAKNRKPGSKR